MKTLTDLLKKPALIFTLALCLVSAGHAQTLGSGTAITTGSTNVLMQTPNFQFITNNVQISIPQETVRITGIANTNEIFSGMYGLYIATPYGTNWVWLSQTNISFALPGGTNNGTYQFTIPPTTLTVGVINAMQASTGSTTNVNNAQISP